MSYLFPVFLLCLFYSPGLSLLTTSLCLWIFLHPSTLARTHIPSVIFHGSSVPLSVSLTCPMPAVFVLLVHRTFLILLPSLMVMWWMKNVDCFYLGRRVEERHGSKGISWNSNFSLLYLRTASWRTTSLCSFLQATNWGWKRLIYHINVNILWVLPVLCSLSKLLSSVYLPVENCFVVISLSSGSRQLDCSSAYVVQYLSFTFLWSVAITTAFHLCR